MSLLERHARPVACGIIAHSPADGELIRSLLETEFTELLVTDPDGAMDLLQKQPALGVLVLALLEIEVAAAFIREFNEAWDGRKPRPQQILFCGRDSVLRAYELCRELSISDYVVFWPVSLDPRRVLMAANRACDYYLAELARWRDEGRAPEPEPEPAPGPKLAPAPTAHIPQLSATEFVPEFEGITLGGPTLLVVEDDAFQQQLVMGMLREEGYATTGVLGGKAALELMKEFRPALILLDVDMPDVDGITVLQLLKMDAQTASIPVIMLTSMNRRDIVIDARRAGAAGFIAKPFARELLLEKVQTVLNTHAQNMAGAQ